MSDFIKHHFEFWPKVSEQYHLPVTNILSELFQSRETKAFVSCHEYRGQAEGKLSIEKLSLIKQDTLKAHRKPVCRSLFHKIPTERLEVQGNQRFVIARLLMRAPTVNDPALSYKSLQLTKLICRCPARDFGPSHAGLHIAWIYRLNFFIFRILLHLL